MLALFKSNSFEPLPSCHPANSLYNTDSKGNRFMEIKRSFKSALRKSGIKDFRFHDLRHTFASQLVMAGVDITTIKELLGHKTLTMTLRYAHLAPSHKVNAVGLLDGEVKLKPTAQLLHSFTKKGSAQKANPLLNKVELRGIEPLTS